ALGRPDLLPDRRRLRPLRGGRGRRPQPRPLRDLPRPLLRQHRGDVRDDGGRVPRGRAGDRLHRRHPGAGALRADARQPRRPARVPRRPSRPALRRAAAGGDPPARGRRGDRHPQRQWRAGHRDAGQHRGGRRQHPGPRSGALQRLPARLRGRLAGPARRRRRRDRAGAAGAARGAPQRRPPRLHLAQPPPRRRRGPAGRTSRRGDPDPHPPLDLADPGERRGGDGQRPRGLRRPDADRRRAGPGDDARRRRLRPHGRQAI
ncbi:MAG: NADH-ubiquinone oxidoreductase chain J, partial [uncultured Thermomicrobiales bacterium]